MKRLALCVAVAVVVVLVRVRQVEASLVVRDWVPGSNDGFITRDTATGLEWLDVTLTQNRSFNEIAGLTLLGWDQSLNELGFFHATTLQVQTFFAHGLADVPDFPPLAPVDQGEVDWPTTDKVDAVFQRTGYPLPSRRHTDAR